MRRPTYLPHSLEGRPARLYTGTVKIALAQINPTVGDFRGNVVRHADYMGERIAEACQEIYVTIREHEIG